MKTLMLAVLTTATLAAPARAAGIEGIAIGVESEVRAQGREALLVIRTGQLGRIAMDHRQALSRAGDRLRAGDGPFVSALDTRLALDRTLDGLQRDARSQFRRPPRHEGTILPAAASGRAVAESRKAQDPVFPKRGWAEHPALTPR